MNWLELIPLGNRAEDFAVALSANGAKVDLADQAANDRFKASRTSRRYQA